MKFHYFFSLTIIAFCQEFINCTNSLSAENDIALELYYGLAKLIPDMILTQRIEVNDKRYLTISAAMNLIIERNSKILVETGTSRFGEKGCEGDGCSTILFGNMANLLGVKLYSVDIDEKACIESKKATTIYGSNVEVVQSDSIIFLTNFSEGMIDFLYLDSFDFDDKNPSPSQEHHLKEIEAVYPKLHKNTIIMMDDCSLVNGGKCALVDQFLKDQKWTVYMSKYQVIYTYT